MGQDAGICSVEKRNARLIGLFEDDALRLGCSRIALKENDDHAVRWRLAYVLRTPHQLLAVRDAVNLAAYELQGEFNLSCSTPVTLTVQQLPPAKD